MARPARRHRRTPGVALTLASALLAWAGCSVERDYEVLSFFFDGVPEPAPAMLEGEPAGGPRIDGSPRMSARGVASAHSAYVERRCTECHGDRAQFGFSTEGFANLGSDACARCHAAGADLAHVHGPVAVGACLLCHEPHVSAHPALLTGASPDLCLACHDPASQVDRATPGHEDLTRDCLDCHRGHGGADRFFLRTAEPAG